LCTEEVGPPSIWQAAILFSFRAEMAMTLILNVSGQVHFPLIFKAL
jgi:hypothetical protein